MTDGRSVARQAGLLVVVFVATFVLLVGGRALLGRASTDGAARSARPAGLRRARRHPPGRPAPPPVPSVGPTGSADETFVLTGAGDIADCTLRRRREDDRDLVCGDPGTVFTAGDNAYEDGSTGEFRRLLRPDLGRVLGSDEPAAGNHDWETPDAAGLPRLLRRGGRAAGRHAGTRTTSGRGTSSSSTRTATSVGGCERHSPQGRWLAARSRRQHRPLHARDLASPAVQLRDPRQRRGGGPVLGAALRRRRRPRHQRPRPRLRAVRAPGPDAKVDRPDGIREFVVGTGGAALRPFAVGAANSQLRLATSHGIIRFDLRKDSYDWTFMPTTGSVTDSGRAPCH